MKPFILVLLPVSVLTISSWDTCFEKIPNRTLIGSSIIIKEDIPLSRCQTACLELSGDRCRSISYSEFDGRCELNKGDHEMSPRKLLPSIGWSDYYIRTCYGDESHRNHFFSDKPSVAIQRDESQFGESCFDTIPGKILIGIVDELIQDTPTLEDCIKACQKRQGGSVTCKSAAYSYKEKECIIASQSREDIPDLFIDDVKYVYIENGCFNKNSVKQVTKKKNPGRKPAPLTPSTAESLESIGTLPKPKPIGMKNYFVGRKPTGVRKSPYNSESSGYDFGISGEKSEDLFTTTTTTTPGTTLHRSVEQSGYESNSEGIIGAGAMDLISTTTRRPAATVEPKMVDNYAVEMTPKSTGYGRRLRDDRVRTCFQEVRPMYAMIESRVAKAYSLEQCTDICRLCFQCLRGKKCRSVAYDRSKELCALSITSLVDGGEDDSTLIFHNRVEANACDPFPIRSRK